MKKKNLKIVKLKRKQNYSYRRKILISDLALLISIGIHDFEKTKKQEVRFNINIDINPSLFPIEDKLNSIVNYETVVNLITKLTKNKHYELLAVSYTHLRAHETPEHLVCRLLLEKKKKTNNLTFYNSSPCISS